MILPTSITGSLPKPSWLSDPSPELFAGWQLEGRLREEAQDDAVRLAIADQESAGLDTVTDGEQRRRHYIWGFLEGLGGTDTVDLGKKVTRGGRYMTGPTDVARVIGDLSWRGPIMSGALTFAKAIARKPVKVTLPGPMTIVDSVLDEHYSARPADLAMRFAELLNQEMRSLAAAGADVIQLDEPAFNIDTKAVADWGIAALEHAFDGVKTTRAVHVCYGYGTAKVISWKRQNRDWGQYTAILPLLARSNVDEVSIELAASGVDPSVIALLPTKKIHLGVISASSEEVETPELVAERIRAGLHHCEVEQLMPCTDCGLVPRSRSVALSKMRSLAAGAALVRKELAAS